MIIAISGKKGSGKDTIGKIIQYYTWIRKHNINENLLTDKQNCLYFLKNGTIQGWGNISERTFSGFSESPFFIKKFATNGVRAFENITWIDYHTITREEKEKIRPLFIKFVEECKNIFSKNIWVDSLINEYIQDTEDKYDVEMSGLGMSKEQLFKTKNNLEFYTKNFPNWIITDMRFLNEMEAVKKKGGITIRVNRNLEESKDQHESETELDNAEFDYVIDNNGTIEELIEKVREILIQEKLI